MNSTTYDIDPEGDVLLILDNPNAPFAVWAEDEGWLSINLRPEPEEPEISFEFDDPACGRSYDSWSIAVPEPEPEPEPVPVPPDEPELAEKAVAAPEAPDQDQEPPEVRMRLSSKHLKMASAYFKGALNDKWLEGSEPIHAEDWDVDALLAVMNIIHGRTRSVPRNVNLEMLAKISVLVDYYKCHEAVELCTDMWIEHLRASECIPEKYGRDLIMWLLVSHVFSKSELFEEAAKAALKESRGPLHTLGLPISSTVVEGIEQLRQELVSKLTTVTQSLLIYLRDKRTKCSTDCSSGLLGALTKQLHGQGLLWPRPAAPFLGYSVTRLMTTINSLSSPARTRYCSCKLQDLLGSQIKQMEFSIPGLVKDLSLAVFSTGVFSTGSRRSKKLLKKRRGQQRRDPF